MDKYMDLIKALFAFVLKLLDNVGVKFDKLDEYKEDLESLADTAKETFKD